MTTTTIEISSYDVYENGRVKLSSMLKYMQQLARDDSDSYGATYPAMRADNMVFVITKLALRFYGEIFDGDVLELRTSSHAIEGATFVRNFVGLKNGETVLAATTDWVLIDFKNRKLLRPSALRFPIPEEHTMNVDVQTKRRIPMPECESPAVHVVRYTELDENRHLNNTVYADILIDNLPGGVPDGPVELCLINYNAEACLGEELHIYSDCVDGTYRSAGIIGSDGRQCYTAELKFR